MTSEDFKLGEIANKENIQSWADTNTGDAEHPTYFHIIRAAGRKADQAAAAVLTADHWGKIVTAVFTRERGVALSKDDIDRLAGE